MCGCTTIVGVTTAIAHIVKKAPAIARASGFKLTARGIRSRVAVDATGRRRVGRFRG